MTAKPIHARRSEAMRNNPRPNKRVPGARHPVANSPGPRRAPERTAMKISGKCACGAVTYEISAGADIAVANCHCRACRRSTGGTYVTWATVPRSAFQWTGAKPGIYKSNPRTRRYFCRSCGAQMALLTTREPKTIDVTVAAFDHADSYAPTRNIWLSRKLSWVPIDRRLKREDRESSTKANPRRPGARPKGRGP